MSESRLTYIKRAGGTLKHPLALYLCSCGKEFTAQVYNVSSGNTKSCGCLRRAVSTAMLTTHGMSDSIEQYTWKNMITRCTNKKSSSYKDYGARGITVCPEWRASFAVFYKDMGNKPFGLTIERVDNDKGYSKDNCIWATHTAQNLNKRNSK